MSDKYNRLVNLLNQMFQMNHAELDFGIYRIMNQKRDEINKFLRQHLKEQVQEEFSQFETGELENRIYSYLADFFGRYYEDGDFISKRRYKENTYAIPYEGEEVKLYWANHDQFYIKTAENFTNYAFKLDNGKRVVFEICEATTERDNNKSQESKRYFVLATDEFNRWQYKIDGSTLTIYFRYQALQGNHKQDSLNAKAVQKILGSLGFEVLQPFIGIAAKAPTEQNNHRTLLEKHLTQYTKSNEFDYFIHKDLKGFLERELDFYIKNEIVRIDDLDTDNEPNLLMYLSQVRVFKRIAKTLIAFLAQIEEFQKKMWLKKKFVVQSDYCMTLDHINEANYPAIVANQAQLQEWVKLGFIDDTSRVTVDYLKAHPYLVLDTVFFPELKAELLEDIDDIDDKTNGLLINSENFQALNFISDTYRERVKYIYIDPPYNTDSTPIVYKNGYRHSSWAQLLKDRLELGKQLLSPTGITTVAIDDTELVNLSLIMQDIFVDYRFSRITVVHNPKGSITKDFNRTHEYALFVTQETDKDAIARTLEENDTPRKLRRWGENSLRTDRRLSFYPIFVQDGQVISVGEVPDDEFHPNARNVKCDNGVIAIYPIDQNGVERRWNFGLDSIHDNLDRITVREVDVTLDLFITHELTVPKTVWIGGEYDAGNYGNTLLINLLGQKLFDYPKSINLVKRCIYLTTNNRENQIVLDFFAGSGTTGHAVISLNREDKGNRKYILVEMGTYFETVTKPRIQKVIYSNHWKEGKPQDSDGSSHIFKYLKLESYEDTLNNLVVQRSEQQKSLLEQHPDFHKEYMVSYMLDIETRDSPSLLNINGLSNPFEYKLRVTGVDNEINEVNVDVVETFNYLLGLHVQKRHTRQDMVIVSGYFTQTKESVLILWRTVAQVDDDTLKLVYEEYEGSQYNVVYINGDNTLNASNVRLIEEDFARKMFA